MLLDMVFCKEVGISQSGAAFWAGCTGSKKNTVNKKYHYERDTDINLKKIQDNFINWSIPKDLKSFWSFMKEYWFSFHLSSTHEESFLKIIYQPIQKSLLFGKHFHFSEGIQEDKRDKCIPKMSKDRDVVKSQEELRILKIFFFF